MKSEPDTPEGGDGDARNKEVALKIARCLASHLKWVVHEPNDERLWERIREDAESYLRRLWLDDQLRGSTELDAFFVQCGRDTTTQTLIQAGRVFVKFGVALERPNEFEIIGLGFHTKEWSPDK